MTAPTPRRLRRIYKYVCANELGERARRTSAPLKPVKDRCRAQKFPVGPTDAAVWATFVEALMDPDLGRKLLAERGPASDEGMGAQIAGADKELAKLSREADQVMRRSPNGRWQLRGARRHREGMRPRGRQAGGLVRRRSHPAAGPADLRQFVETR